MIFLIFLGGFAAGGLLVYGLTSPEIDQTVSALRSKIDWLTNQNSRLIEIIQRNQAADEAREGGEW